MSERAEIIGAIYDQLARTSRTIKILTEMLDTVDAMAASSGQSESVIINAIEQTILRCNIIADQYQSRLDAM